MNSEIQQPQSPWDNHKTDKTFKPCKSVNPQKNVRSAARGVGTPYIPACLLATPTKAQPISVTNCVDKNFVQV